jgi:crotonobetainyl-CoA:carnitine CoA-transferase CaiB-like acyl-CoA transferase
LSASPLSGLQVVDLSRHLPGPLAAHLLADLGARIFKVEEPLRGDPLREAPPVREATGSLAALLLSGTESIALDLKQPAAQEILHQLLSRADILLESFRPGTLARLGFPSEELRERYPRLVICSLSGWGSEGPYAKRAGHDLTYQALAGTLAATSATLAMPAVPVADLIGAWSAVTAILAAMVERERTGQGSRIDAALFDAGFHAGLTAWAAEADGPKRIGKSLPLSGAFPCYNLYRTSDGHPMALAALEPHFWERFCNASGRPNLIRRQYDGSLRARQLVQELLGSRTRAEWMDLFAREDIPAEPVLTPDEARRHPQAAEREMLRLGPDSLLRIGFPARIDGERPRSGDKVPQLGEHTKAVLAELGIADERSRRERRESGVGPRFHWRRLVNKLFS